MVSIGLSGTLRQRLLLFVLASLFAHLRFPFMVAITGMLVRLHCVVGAKSFSSGLPVSALSSLCVPPPLFRSWFVFCWFRCTHSSRQSPISMATQWRYWFCGKSLWCLECCMPISALNSVRNRCWLQRQRLGMIAHSQWSNGLCV